MADVIDYILGRTVIVDPFQIYPQGCKLIFDKQHS